MKHFVSGVFLPNIYVFTVFRDTVRRSATVLT